MEKSIDSNGVAALPSFVQHFIRKAAFFRLLQNLPSPCRSHRRCAQSRFYTLQSSNNTVLVTGYGLFGDQNVCRDGDGRIDLAIYRRGAAATDQAVWWIKPSSGSGGYIVVPFGLTGNGTTSFDTPIPGDYDGDGKFDLAVYRFGSSPANNYIILNSSSGAVSFMPFGNFNTDYILPGDYDGDGKYDLAIDVPGHRSSIAGLVDTTKFKRTNLYPAIWHIIRSADPE